MINVVVILCSFLAQINIWLASPQNVLLLSRGPQTEVVVHFENEPNLGIGSPVYSRGQVVGTVGRISPLEGEKAIEVILELGPAALKKGSVALVSSAWLLANDSPKNFVELLSPQDPNTPIHPQGTALSGFTSFEEFWLSDTAHAWIDTLEVQLG